MGSTRSMWVGLGWIGLGWTYVMGWVGLNFFDPPWWVGLKNLLNPTHQHSYFIQLRRDVPPFQAMAFSTTFSYS